MKTFRIYLLLIAIILIQSCATTQKEVPTGSLDTSSNITRHYGSVINIREVKKDASLGKQFKGALIGALIGGQIGGGSGNDIAATTGAFIGQNIANNKYGEFIDRITLNDSNGNEYVALVHDHSFRVGDKVVFTIVRGHVSAIIHDK